MAKGKTTPAERKAFIESQRAQPRYDSSHRRILPVDMSFIDRKGNIVHPNRTDYEATKRGNYNTDHGEALKLNKQYDSLISKYGKDSTEVYKFETEELGMHGKRRSSRLEGGLAVIGLIAGIFFLSTNITGNVIGNMTNSASNIIGVVLLFLGLIGGFLWMKKR